MEHNSELAGSKTDNYVNGSPSKRALEPDPDYEDAIVAPNVKRLKQIEENAQVDAQVKVRLILENQFTAEIKRRNDEIDEIQHRITIVQSQLHFARYAASAVYYSGKQLQITPSTTPFIHPAVKSHLGKKPKAWEADESKATPSISLQTAEKLDVPSILENTSKSLYKPPIQPELPTAVRGSRYKTKRRVVVGNVSKWIPLEERTDNASHKWMVYVRGPQSQPDLSDILKSVRFFLHPSYVPNDVVEVKAPPFHLTRRGWGEFPLRAQLHFHHRLDKPVDIVHHLKLDRSCSGLQMLGSETVVDTWIHDPNAETDPIENSVEVQTNNTEMEAETVDPLLNENRTIIEGPTHSSSPPCLSPDGVSIKEEPESEPEEDSKPESWSEKDVQIKQEPPDDQANYDSAPQPIVQTTATVKNPKLSLISHPPSAAAASNNNQTITCLNRDGKVVQLPISALQKILSGAKVVNGTGIQIRTVTPSSASPTAHVIRLTKPTGTSVSPGFRSPASPFQPQQQSLLKPPFTKASVLPTPPVRNPSSVNGNRLASSSSSIVSNSTQNGTNGAPSHVKHISLRLPTSIQGQSGSLIAVRSVSPLSSQVSLLSANTLIQAALKKSVVEAALTQALGQDAKYKEHKAKLQSIFDYVSECNFTDVACSVRFLLAKIPLVTNEAQDYLYRQIRPFTAPSLDVFVAWTIGKQRASEMTRAKLIRDNLLKLGLKDVWSTKQIITYARRHGYSPLCTWKPKLESVDIEEPNKIVSQRSSLTEVTDIEQQLTIEGQKSSSTWEDPLEIDIESIDEGPVSTSPKRIPNKAQPKIFMQSKEDELGQFVAQEMKKQGITFWPEEIDTSVWHDTAKFVLKHIWRLTAEDMVRRTLGHVFQRTVGRIPESIELDDAVMAVRSRPEFDCLTNQGFGVRIEPGVDPATSQARSLTQ